MCSIPTTQSYGGTHTGKTCWRAWVYSQRTCSWPCGPHHYRHGKSAGIVYWGQHLPRASLPSPRASPPPPACPSSEYSGRRRGICVPSPHLRDNMHVTSQRGTGKVYWTIQQHTTLQASSVWMQLQATKFHFSKTTFIVKRKLYTCAHLQCTEYGLGLFPMNLHWDGVLNNTLLAQKCPGNEADHSGPTYGRDSFLSPDSVAFGCLTTLAGSSREDHWRPSDLRIFSSTLRSKCREKSITQGCWYVRVRATLDSYMQWGRGNLWSTFCLKGKFLCPALSLHAHKYIYSKATYFLKMSQSHQFTV